MDRFAPIELYCERTAPGLFNEPLNTVSNLAFLATATLATAKRPARRDFFLRVLIALVCPIAVGPTLYLALLSAMRFGTLAPQSARP